MNKETAKKYAVKAARILDGKKGEDIKIYDLNGLSSLCDYIVIATANSAPHLNALEQETGTELKKDGVYKTNRDGGESGVWRVSDYGGFMLHVITAQARVFYALDHVFGFGKIINWALPAPKPAVKKPAANKKKTAAKKTISKKPAVKKAAKKAVKKPAKTSQKKTKTAKKPAKKAKKAKK
ncbi:MAG: ribosome silencing factor [Elusimicrobiota bacterium]|jgi:ribosome-associated protein|nr:ribosome silencing factor [Elusimicrobiota bacterium]